MTDLERKVLGEIEQRNLAPRPYFVFFAKRSVFFTLAITSILLGAISSAVLMFAVSDYYATGWRVLDNLPLDEVVLSIPVLWLVSMPLFLASAYFGLRNTRRGYRFGAGRIVLLSLGTSIGLGLVLHFFNAGQMVNGYMIANIDWYRQQADVPFAFWSRPERGFLGGRADQLLSNQTLRLIDFDLNVWTVDISVAQINLDNSILSEGDVAIRGQVTGPMQFRADVIEAFD